MIPLSLKISGVAICQILKGNAKVNTRQPEISLLYLHLLATFQEPDL